MADEKVLVEDLVQRNFAASAPYHKWFGDITCIRTWAGWLYLAVILDAYSRKVVGWAMAVFEFIAGCYNQHRRHSTLGYSSPAEVERRTSFATLAP